MGKEGIPPPITSVQKKVLEKIYYTDKNYFGRDRLWRLPEVQQAKISRRQVFDWLTHQELWQLYKVPRKSKTIRPTVLKQPLKQIGIDLIDMTRYASKGYTWILTAIDLFSKKAWAVALKDKTGQSVAEGMKHIVREIDDTPDSIRSDNGSEFISKEFRAYMQEAGIKQVFSLAGKPQSNGQVERFNGILKRMINMNRTESDQSDWPKVLPQLVSNYNRGYQRVIQNTPDEVAQADKHEDTAKLIEKNAKEMTHLEPPKAKVGLTVRVKQDPDGNLKFSRQIYTIIAVHESRTAYTSPTYVLENKNGQKMKERFTRNDLLVIPKDTMKSVKEPEKFTISKIVGPKLITGVQGYFVRWRNYPASENTFESRESLQADVPKLIAQFDKAHNVQWFKNKVTFSP
jgi:transposase InsO family protein